MTSLISKLATAILSSVTSDNGQSTLPNWLVTPLAMLSGQDIATDQQTGWADESLIRKAVALYRASSVRGNGKAATSWQFSPDGSKAVQVLAPVLDEQQRQAFIDFSRRLSSITLNHPRLAPILEAGYQQGYPFLAARVGEGFQSLPRRLGLPLEPRKALAIAEQITSALEYAHYRGVFHGSFDLGDILVNQRGQLTLLGVGVEQMRQRMGTVGSTLPSQLAPPEVEKGAQVPDANADVYAMGAMLYVLLTGRVPAFGQRVQLSQTLADVPMGVDVVLTRSLAERPEDRYSSLAEMAQALRVAIRAPHAVAKPSVAPAASAVRTPSSPIRAAKLTRLSQPPKRLDGFPEELPMPEIDFSAFENQFSVQQDDDAFLIPMPPTPEMPKVDWVDRLSPLDVTPWQGKNPLPYAAPETLAPDPLVAAMMAVKATEQTQQNRAAARAARQQQASSDLAAASVASTARPAASVSSATPSKSTLPKPEKGPTPPKQPAAAKNPTRKPAPPPAKPPAAPPAPKRRIRRP